MSKSNLKKSKIFFLLPIFLTAFIFIFFVVDLALAVEVPKEMTLNIPVSSVIKVGVGGNALGVYVQAWFQFLLSVIGIIATVMIMIGGFKYLTSQGDKGKIQDAQNMMISAITGLILAFGSVAILGLVNPNLLTLKVITLDAINYSGTYAEGGGSTNPQIVRPQGSGGGSGNNINLWEPHIQPQIEKIKQMPGVANVTTYPEHDDRTNSAGMAADVWCPNNDCTQVAEHLAQNYQDLNIDYIIWNQGVWNPDSHSQGSRMNPPSNPNGDPTNLPASQWDRMTDRGGATANHLDHIHVSFR